MTTQNEHLQQIWRAFEHENDHAAASAREVVEWAVRERKLTLPPVDPIDILAGQMASALREEYAKDDKGRRYRVNHAVRVTKNGVQTTFWGILGFAPRAHMERAFTQRREQVIGDLVQLQVDVEVYNEMNPTAPPIQLELDFKDDVAERRAG
ncbi:MAG: hypothetical protein KIS96_06280 [Bauldia sp.]|nr:hypothetical protein [Bauldia sp.]